MTRIHIAATPRRIAPFDDPPGDVLVANRPLRDWQAEMVRDAGLLQVDRVEPPCLVVPDTLFTTGGALRRLVDGAGGRNAVLVLADSVFGRSTAHVQPGVEPIEGGWRFSEVRFVSGGDEPAADVVIDPDEHTWQLGLPAPFGGDTEIALPRHPVMTVHHWVHILWANQAAGSLEVRSVPRWKGALRLLWAFVRCWSLNRWKLLARLNTIGRGCDIHPTALVEGSTLGDGVTVGPHARILFSRVGDGATVMTGAEVVASTVGERAVVGQLTGLRLCVMYPGSFAGQYLMQACVIGRDTVTTGGSFSIDMNFDHEIRVPLDGALHGTGSRFLGSAFGHDCRIGTGIWLASGRAIPNGSFVVRDPRQVIAHVPETPGDGRPVRNVDGRLRPVED